MMYPSSSTPFNKQALLNGSMGKVNEPPGKETVCEARSTVSSARGASSTRSKSILCVSSSTVMGMSPFFNELLRKISAKDVEMTARNPYAVSAQGACSRLEPQPKLSPANRICAPFDSGLLMINSSFGDLSWL